MKNNAKKTTTKLLCLTKRAVAAGVAAATLMTGGAFSDIAPMGEVRAMVTGNAITYEYYTVTLKNTVPASWLFVGTYLMSARAITPQLYAQALRSRETYDQFIAFYTSELDGSQWKDIKNAESIATILPTGQTYSENDLFPYLITVVVGDDGIPRDPVSGEPIDIFNSDSPYEMENIPQLDGIQEYYEGITAQGTDSQQYIYHLLNQFFENDNLDTYDRESLDVAAAYKEYGELAQDPESLEDVWDQAMLLNPAMYPEEYKDLMLVMQNWPNVRDKKTDRADAELEELNTLYLSLLEDKQEEADAVLYVSEQVDAERRAEIYYNLIHNENLTGSFLGNRDEVLEELTLRREEVNAEMMRLGAKTDEAQAPIKQLREEINALSDENEALQKEIDEETSRWAAEGKEEALATLEAEYAAMQEAFAPIEAEYRRLDAELDAATDEAQAADDGQKGPLNDIADIKKDIADREKDIEAELSAKKKEIQEKTARFVAADARREEYYEGLAQIEIKKSNIDRLSSCINAENTHYEALLDEASFYTTSRLTALVNAGKIYDPEKKQDLDHQAEKSRTAIAAMTASKNALEKSMAALDAEMSAIGEDLALEDEIPALQAEYDDLEAQYTEELSTLKARADIEIEAKREEYAANTPSYQEQLRKLKAKNDAFTEYETTYLAEREVLLSKEREVIAARDEKEAHEALLASDAQKIADNEPLIASKEGLIPSLQPAVTLLEGQVQSLQEEVDGLDVLILTASTITSGDKIRRLEYGNTRNSLQKRMAQVTSAFSDAKRAQAKVIEENGKLLAEKKACEAAPEAFLAQYNASVEAINAEEDEREGKLALMKNNIKDAKAAIEREKEIRQQRLEEAKEVYDTQIKDNAAKIEKINETVAENNKNVQDYVTGIFEEFGVSLEHLNALINAAMEASAGAGSVAETFDERALREKLEELAAVQGNYDDLQKQKSELSAQRDAEDARLQAMVSEYNQKYLDVQSEGNPIYYAKRDDWKAKEKERENFERSKYDLERVVTGYSIDQGHLTEARKSYDWLMSSFKADYDTKTARMQELDAEIARLEKEIADLESQIKATPANKMFQRQNLQRQRGKKMEQKSNDENEYARLQSDNDRLAYEKRLNEFYKLLNQFGFFDFDKENGDFYEYADEKRAEFAALEEAAQAEVDAWTEANDARLTELKTAEQEAKSATSKAWSDMHTQMDAIKEELKEARAPIDASIAEMDARIADIEKEMRDYEEGVQEQYGTSLLELAKEYVEVDKIYRSLDYVDLADVTEFGPAPTLNFLYAGSDSGTPKMGRTFTNMADYRSIRPSIARDTDGGIGGIQVGLRPIFVRDRELVSLISSASDACETAYEDYTARSMSRGETAADYTGFLLSRQVAKKASDRDAAMPYLQMIVDLTNIEAGNMIHIEREVSLLQGYLVPFSMSDFTEEKTTEQMDNYHYYIRAVADRDSLTNAIAFVQDRLEYAYSLRGSFTDQGYGDLIESHILWLENLLRTLQERLAAENPEDYGSGENDYAKDLQEAIDDGDLKRAKQIEDLLKGLIESGEGDGNSGTPKNPDPGPPEPTDIDPNTRPKPEAEIQELILDEIDNPEYDPTQDLNKFVNTPGDLGGLKTALEEAGAPTPVINKIALAKKPEAPSGGGGGKTPGGSPKKSDLKDAITAALNKNLEDLDDEEGAEALAALIEEQEENPDDDLESLIDDLLNQLLREGNPYIYQQYLRDSAREYVSMAAVDRCRKTSGFRYVEEGGINEATMSQIFGGSASYTFTVGSKDVTKNNGETDTLDVAAVKQADKYGRKGDDAQYAYLYKDDAKRFLYVSGRYIKGTDMAVLVTQGMEPKVRTLVEALEAASMITDE